MKYKTMKAGVIVASVLKSTLYSAMVAGIAAYIGFREGNSTGFKRGVYMVTELILSLSDVKDKSHDKIEVIIKSNGGFRI